MAPIYESDVAEERWSKTEWNHYELWEKVEQRVRRTNRLWIAGTVVVFLVLSSIPIVMQKGPKWATLGSLRTLGETINAMKAEAAIEHAPLRIRFPGDGSLNYQVEKVEHCGENVPPGKMVRSGSLVKPGQAADYVLLSRARGESLGVPGLIEEFCYDPLSGSLPAKRGETITGFAVIPSVDLAAGKLDRLSVLLLNGDSAEVSFE